jgi:hypothetical protein
LLVDTDDVKGDYTAKYIGDFHNLLEIDRWTY